MLCAFARGNMRIRQSEYKYGVPASAGRAAALPGRWKISHSRNLRSPYRLKPGLHTLKTSLPSSARRCKGFPRLGQQVIHQTMLKAFTFLAPRARLSKGSRRGNEADGCARLPENPPRYLGGYGP